MVRTASIINSEPIILQADSRSSLVQRKKTKRMLGSRKISTPDLVDESDSSHSTAGRIRGSNSKYIPSSTSTERPFQIFLHHFRVLDSLQAITKRLDEQGKALAAVKINLDKLTFAPPAKREQRAGLNTQYQTILYVAVGLFFQSILTWFFSRK